MKPHQGITTSQNALLNCKHSSHLMAENIIPTSEGCKNIGQVVNRVIVEPFRLRNCDVGTPSEQAARFKAFCTAHWCEGNECSEKNKCPINLRSDCKLTWAQMPYQEEKNK